MYGRKSGLADCRGGMADYICTVVERADLPAGTSRVECRVNGENELLLDEYDVVRNDRGFYVRSVSLKASAKLNER